MVAQHAPQRQAAATAGARRTGRAMRAGTRFRGLLRGRHALARLRLHGGQPRLVRSGELQFQLVAVSAERARDQDALCGRQLGRRRVRGQGERSGRASAGAAARAARAHAGRLSRVARAGGAVRVRAVDGVGRLFGARPGGIDESALQAQHGRGCIRFARGVDGVARTRHLSRLQRRRLSARERAADRGRPWCGPVDERPFGARVRARTERRAAAGNGHDGVDGDRRPRARRRARASGHRALHRQSLVRELLGPHELPPDRHDAFRDLLGGRRRDRRARRRHAFRRQPLRPARRTPGSAGRAVRTAALRFHLGTARDRRGATAGRAREVVRTGVVARRVGSGAHEGAPQKAARQRNWKAQYGSAAKRKTTRMHRCRITQIRRRAGRSCCAA
ncbi:hypothetical protein PT2222_80206 [Paraburkholderia tropica]